MWKLATALTVILASTTSRAASADITLALLDQTPPSQARGWIDGSSVAQSPDGRYVVHASLNGQLFEGQVDNDRSRDVFVYDRAEDRHRLVSHRAGAPTAACQGESASRGRGISADGRWIAFTSDCQDLVSGSAGEAGNVFLHDRDNAVTRLLSRVPGSGLPAGSSQLVDLSADGRWLLFYSRAASLGGQFSAPALFLVDRDDPTGTLVRVADGVTQQFTGLALSADGRYVAFVSALPNLDPAVPDQDAIAEIFRYDRLTGSTRMVTRVQGQNLPSGSTHALETLLLSGDGATLFYTSSASNISGSTQGTFVHDLALDQNALLNATSRRDFLTGASADGEWLLLGQDRGLSFAVRLLQRSTGANILVDHGLFPGSFSNGTGVPVGISADGTKVLFISSATDLIGGLLDQNQALDAFLYNRETGSTRLLSAAAGTPLQSGNGGIGSFSMASLSATGTHAVFPASASNLVADSSDANANVDLFQSDTASGQTHLITGANTAVAQTWPFGTAAGLVSDDGRWITRLRSGVLTLVERDTGATWLVSRSVHDPGRPANNTSTPQAISPDGRWVWFWSQATDLVDKFVQSRPQPFPVAPTYLFDRDNGVVIMLMHKPGVPATTLPSDAILGGVSADARWSVFGASPTGLIAGVPLGTPAQVFLYDREARSARLLSHAAGAVSLPANGESTPLGLSADGRWVLFRSAATDLVANVVDTNNGADVYLYDRDSGLARLLSHEAGASLRTANGATAEAVLSADGSTVILASAGTNLVAGLLDDNAGLDLFRQVLATGTTTLVSRAAGQTLRTANGATELLELPPQAYDSPDVRSLSADGQQVLVRTWASDLVAGVTDTNAAADLVLLDPVDGPARLLSYVPGAPLQAAPASSYSAMLAAGGERVLIATTAALAAGTPPTGFTALFLNDAVAGNRQVIAALPEPNGASLRFDFDARGEVLLFDSETSDLIPAVLDQNRRSDGFMALAPGDTLFADGFENAGASP